MSVKCRLNVAIKIYIAYIKKEMNQENSNMRPKTNECYHVSMQECLFMTLAYQKTMQLSQRDG